MAALPASQKDTGNNGGYLPPSYIYIVIIILAIIMQAGDSKGKSMSPKTPQRVFLAEVEAMPVESVQLKLQLSNHQARRFDKEAIKKRAKAKLTNFHSLISYLIKER